MALSAFEAREIFMKKKALYESPEMETMELLTEDIFTASTLTVEPDDSSTDENVGWGNLF